MKIKTSFGLFIGSIILFISACETDDIEPTITVSLSSTQIAISEASGATSIVASLNAESAEAVTINLLATGTALNNTDYSLSSTSIIIPAGSLSQNVVLTAIQDTIEEGTESADISISSITGATAKGAQQVSVTIEDDDVAPVAQIIVNEVLYDPPSGTAGDANGDGTRSPSQDEFIEFVNASTQAFDLSGYKIYDAAALSSASPRHIFPANSVIPAGGVLVVFGGGTPTGNFGGSIVQTSTTGNMNLSNAGDLMSLTDSADVVLVTFDITPLSNNPDESYTRNPDVTGAFEQHNDNTPLLFSPGTKIDGSPF